MTQIYEDLRSETFVMLIAEMSCAGIDMWFNSQQSTNTTLEQRFQATRNVRDRQRQGQSNITAHLQD